MARSNRAGARGPERVEAALKRSSCRSRRARRAAARERQNGGGTSGPGAGERGWREEVRHRGARGRPEGAGRGAEGGRPRRGGASSPCSFSSPRSFSSPFSCLFPVPSFLFRAVEAELAPQSRSCPTRAGWSRDARPAPEGGPGSRCSRARGTRERDGGNGGSPVTSSGSLPALGQRQRCLRAVPSTSQELSLIECWRQFKALRSELPC
ncbi:uncharacterized protein LOC128809058 [Vidua macroura]|uniref:uncharacterized protein LOC128809058 n=1 Tax=Vidua macroura TaxID=187451 RepID=UPI0023A7CB3E|nr:uncharacterized protein LOC128809058 [Vidua macroura]